MNIPSRQIHKLSVFACVSALTLFSGSSNATPLLLTDEPLFLSSGVQPNIIMAVDDSGSMDGETLFLNNDGAVWWRTSAGAGCPQGFIGCGTTGTADTPEAGRPNFNHAGAANGTWKKYVYLFPIGSGTGLRIYSDADNDHFAIPPLPQFAWTRSPDFNAAYFDPSETYEPWEGYGATSFANVSPSAARTDPTQGANTFDLTADRMSGTSVTTAAACSGGTPALAGNHQFRMYPGMVIPQGACYRADGTTNWQLAATALTIASGTHNASTLTTTATGSGLGVAIRYFPATFWLRDGATLPSSYGYNATPLTGGMGPASEPLLGYEIKSANFASPQQYQDAIQNFANWWTYYRKRHAATRGGIGSAFKGISRTRIGSFRINNLATVAMRDLDVAADRNTFYSDVYGYVNNGGTPNREAVYHMGNQFNRTGAGAPITHACQKNFGILFTDGFSNNTTPASVGNVDGSMGSPFADDVSNTMADYATYFYANRLRPDLAAGRVSVPAACSASPPNPRLDCNDDLHMSFFAVTLGTRGLIYDVNMDQTNDPFANPPTWPTTFQPRHPSAVDDLWHATINTRGGMLNARTPKDVGEQLASVLRSIAERTSSASSASVNSGSISSETRVYQAKFNSAGWTGQLLSYPVNAADGSLIMTGPDVWDASDNIPAPNARNIITVNSNGAPTAFRWNSATGTFLDATRKAELNSDEFLLDYLRGDGSREGNSASDFRIREDAGGPNKLGDIVASAPLFVGRPPFRYRDSLESVPYSTFAGTARDGMVYVGANDGMLHGFNADTGAEVFAFIPSPVFDHLPNLASQDYNHQFYVDGSPSMGDAFFNGAWRTVLVGGLNKGGQGIYALDITNPTTLANAENNAGSIVLWEFTDADDPDLGLTYSQPAIVRLQNGRWAAVFGNGYNSTLADGHASTTGNAVLFIKEFGTGTVYKLDTGVGTAQAPAGISYDNGLSTPALVDMDGDRIVEYAYAGDLYGNMWKFDLRDLSTLSTPLRLYEARDGDDNPQPITVRPEVGRGPGGAGTIVLFGTGKYLENSDKLLTPEREQSFYGIVDRNTGTAADSVTGGRASLTRQTIMHEGSATFVRQTEDGPVTYESDVRITSDNALGTNSGWYLDLVSPSGYQGEKQVSNPIIRNGNVVFTTLIPDPDPCGFGGESWIMELNLLDGSRLKTTPFDLNNDGQFTDADHVTITVTLEDGTTQEISVPISGLGSTEGILQSPGVLEGEMGEGRPVQYKYLPGSSGGIQRVTENPGVSGTGRQSWRQVR